MARFRLNSILPLAVLFLSVTLTHAAPSLIATSSGSNDFVLADARAVAAFLIEPSLDGAVARAAADLRGDIERVTGRQPAVREHLGDDGTRSIVITGILGQSRLIDQLAAADKLDVSRLRGAWESFVIAVVGQPFPGVDQALVIAGSDRRGAIYGCYELSAAIGVSPWHWWADVPPQKRSTLAIGAGTHRFGPPSVKYRGIFLNDEDWGLQPWAAKTFEPETGDIGPKTYARIFELLLRLKANTIWPGMHPTTRAFNHYPRNKEVADDYAIVMGSSHAEPMLRNNVDEWTAPKEDYNYLTNRDGLLRYWEQRVAENGRFENIYTLGMRGIHDSNMQGAKTDAERIQVLEQVFADQRALIARHVLGRSESVRDGSASSLSAEVPQSRNEGRIPPAGLDAGQRPALPDVPQMFCAYKEVLDLYRQGLRVPTDVTIVWPDDNFGYIRNFATAVERQTRTGGFGVYYHLSYLGRPLSYLWLCTTPPALVWEEMHKAYEHGADRIWIANVGDLKPAEIPTEFFLQMAWDIDRWRADTLPGFLRDWAARDFGPQHAGEIAALLADYYLINFQRKPEHLQWWLPRQPSRPSVLTDLEVQARLDAVAKLHARADALRQEIPASQQDAFYQLVYYPVVGAALANERFFEAERGNVAAARAADARLIEETRFFNEELAGGKWRGIMSLEPAGDEWASMRLARWSPPEVPRAPVPSPDAASFISLDAADFTVSTSRAGAAWTVIPGLGRSGAAATVLPTTVASAAHADAVEAAPRVEYDLVLPRTGEFTLQVHLLPTHPIAGTALRFAVALDDDAPQWVSLELGDGGPAWAQGVLDSTRIASTRLIVRQPGPHTLKIYGPDAGVVFDKLVIDLGGLTPSYLGP